MSTREEMLKLAEDRGFTTVMHSSDNEWYSLTHNTYTFGLQLWPETKEFELTYMSGMFKFTSGKLGSFDNDTHFNRYLRQMRTYCLFISDARDIIVERNERRNRLKQQSREK